MLTNPTKSITEFFTEISGFFVNKRDIAWLGIWAGITYGFFGAILVLFSPGNIYLLLFMGGILNNTMFELRIMDLHIQHRLKLNIIANLACTIAFILGCICGENTILALSGLVIASLIISMTADMGKVPAMLALLGAIVFVLGLNLPATPAIALCRGLAIAGGAAIMTIVTYTHFSLTTDRTENTLSLFTHFKGTENFSVTNRKLRYGFWLAFTSTVSYCFALLLGLPNSFWAPMTVFVVLKFNREMTKMLVWNRLIGTFCGVLAAAPIVLYMHNMSILLILIPPLMLLITILASTKYYGICVFFMTILVVVGYACIKHASVIILESRIIDTFIAVGISIIVITILAPPLRKLMLITR